MATFYLRVYGCQMNEAEGSQIMEQLLEWGYEEANDIYHAQIVILHSCVVRQRAEDRILGMVHNIRKNNPDTKIILSGCLANLLVNEDYKTPYLEKNKKQAFDLILPFERFGSLQESLSQWFPHTNCQKKKEEAIRGEVQTAFLSISEGCDNFCSYCIVPFSRGRERSIPFTEILSQARTMVSNGIIELTLLGQNVNSFWLEGEKREVWRNSPQPKLPLIVLLLFLAKIRELKRIYFLTSHPKDFSFALVDLLATHKSLCEYIHLPLQSGSDNILEKMNRSYTLSDFKKIVTYARQKLPGVAITTDIIVGFPGESEKEFNQTAQAMKDIGFDHAYIAEYSPRSYTAASNLEDDVGYQEKHQRKMELIQILKNTAWERNKKFLNKKVRVLVKHKVEENLYFGTLRNWKKIHFKSREESIGDIVEVEVTEVYPWHLFGQKTLH